MPTNNDRDSRFRHYLEIWFEFNSLDAHVSCEKNADDLIRHISKSGKSLRESALEAAKNHQLHKWRGLLAQFDNRRAKNSLHD